MESASYKSCCTSLNHFQLFDVFFLVWIPNCCAVFQVGAHHRHVSHCFSLLAAYSEVASQEPKHAVGLLHYPGHMRFPIQIVG